MFTMDEKREVRKWMKNNEQESKSLPILTSFADKHAYCEQVKMANFTQSMRLEGYDISVPSQIKNTRERNALRLQLIRYYQQENTEKV